MLDLFSDTFAEHSTRYQINYLQVWSTDKTQAQMLLQHLMYTNATSFPPHWQLQLN